MDIFLKVGQLWRPECIHFSLGGPVGIQPLTKAVLLQQGASVFLFYYSLLFDDSPAAECQRAGGGTGLGAGRIYCHDAGDRSHGSLPSSACSLLQHLQNQAYHVSIQV